MDPAALPAAVCRADADDPRLLGRRSVGEAKVQEKRLPEEPLLRPGRAKVMQEVRAAKCKEAEIVGLLREGMFVTIHEVCSKSAHVEYGLTGLSGWVTLRKNSEPVLKEDPWAPRPAMKRLPKASEEPLEPREKVCARLAAAGPGKKAAGSCAGDHRSLPESAWQRIHGKFDGEVAPSSTSSHSEIQHGEAMTSTAVWAGDHRSLPASAWKTIHQKFEGEVSRCSTSSHSEIQHGEAMTSRAVWAGDHRSLPASAWKTIHEKFDGEVSRASSALSDACMRGMIPSKCSGSALISSNHTANALA
ncbi:hypothetical protein AK812_SmicGene1776 [Symbiodinium microadriaticum]|uniref:Uncharacterized protein n=1 Tax=Symbiodinium microadriaticum TaxID=2951 RepID=A0A1Q9F3B3_SYMMI|nr:hypothetical protein AK812_SmicGene1776 [Symbiodinium microadriaticum]